MSRIALFAVVLALIATIVPACAQTPAAEEPTEKILVVGTTDSATTLDPADAYDYFSSNVMNNVSECLVQYKAGTSDIVPCLATDWTISDDGLTYVFTLRQGVKFHDGTDFNAEVAKFSLDRARTLGGDPGFLLDDIANIEATGDYEITITLGHASSPFLSKLSYTVGCIVPPSAYTATEKNPTDLVGTGPYILDSWVEGDQLVLLKNNDYWGDPAYADRVVVKFYGDNSAAMKLALEQKEIDVAYRSFLPLEEEGIKANADVAFLEGPAPFIRYCIINVTKAPFDDIHVRKALALALDRQDISDTVFQGTVSPLYSMVPDGMWSYKPVFQHDPEPDIEGALAELAEAGYTPDNPLSMELWYTPTHYGPTEADLAQVMKTQFEATGAIQVELMNSEWGRYTDDLVAGSMGFLLLGWFPDYFDPDDYLYPFFSTEGGQSMGTFYSDPEMEAMLLNEIAKSSVADRTPVLEDIQDKMFADIPAIPLFQRPQFVAFQPDVKGVILDPLQIFRYYLISKDSWQ